MILIKLAVEDYDLGTDVRTDVLVNPQLVSSLEPQTIILKDGSSLIGTRLSMSSGDIFFVAADMYTVAKTLTMEVI